MQNIWFIVLGVISGVLGGMGMGGGTILIPALTILLNVAQLNAQALNLIAFLPMAIISLILHFKNKLVSLKGLLFIIIPAVIFSALGAVLSSMVSTEWLSRLFGAFLVGLSLFQFFPPCVNKGDKD